jgi:thioredoxin 1
MKPKSLFRIAPPLKDREHDEKLDLPGNLRGSGGLGTSFVKLLEDGLSKEGLRDALRKARLPASGTKRELAKKLVKEVEFPADVLSYLNVPALRSICQFLGLNQKGTKSELISAIESSSSEGAHPTRIIRLTDANFSDAIMTNEKLVAEVFTPWCSFCQEMAPAMRRMAEIYGQRIRFAKVNGDFCRATVDKMGVKGYPTFLLFRAGSEVFRNNDNIEPEELESTIRRLLEP